MFLNDGSNYLTFKEKIVVPILCRIHCFNAIFMTFQDEMKALKIVIGFHDFNFISVNTLGMEISTLLRFNFNTGRLWKATVFFYTPFAPSLPSFFLTTPRISSRFSVAIITSSRNTAVHLSLSQYFLLILS